MDSLIGYGFFLLLALEQTHDAWRRRLLVAGTLVLVAVIGFSRMYLGVHFMTDIVAGYLAGTVWLLVCIAGYRVARLRLTSVRSGRSI
jgi:undecaprenyl-diphosphatase